MNLGFYIIMAAQFFSSLADNALLVAAIALLLQADSPAWLTPYLKLRRAGGERWEVRWSQWCWCSQSLCW